ncbi:hypothetical protein GCM10023331_17460 [Algivirga pacifica]|uniref:Uncharacterized protein n=1 Tax=Algivirga pacifica TaxID=1162670 RepID=A0ABP9DCY8_9BACT
MMIVIKFSIDFITVSFVWVENMLLVQEFSIDRRDDYQYALGLAQYALDLTEVVNRLVQEQFRTRTSFGI